MWQVRIGCIVRTMALDQNIHIHTTYIQARMRRLIAATSLALRMCVCTYVHTLYLRYWLLKQKGVTACMYVLYVHLSKRNFFQQFYQLFKNAFVGR